ncbi:Cytochrome P450 2A1 [Halotydeus destructor]|nr:Cytochrome P450 2A1 [Halotydeus destructor]
MSKQLDLVPIGDLIGIVTALALILIVIKWFRNGSQVPGPMQVPFFGYLPLIGTDPVTKFLQLSQRYGQVYKLSFLARDYYVISGFSAIKESLSKQAVNDKPLEYNYFSASVGWNSVSALNGARWKQQRKIILSKVFAMSVISDMSPKMVAIGQDLVKFLESTSGQKTNIRTALSMTALNTVSSVVYSKRYDWEDELFKRLRQDLSDFVHSVDPFFFLLGGPYLKMYMEMFHGKQHSDFVAICKRCLETSMSIVDEKLNSDTHQRDFAEAYLSEHRKELDANIPFARQEFTLDRLARTIFTLIQAGTDTTAETLYYAFYFMARYRDVQAKVQAEIDTVVGRDRRPTLADKSSFVYTRAVIEEILRFSSLVPMGVPRQIQSRIQPTQH